MLKRNKHILKYDKIKAATGTLAKKHGWMLGVRTTNAYAHALTWYHLFPISNFLFLLCQR